MRATGSSASVPSASSARRRGSTRARRGGGSRPRTGACVKRLIVNADDLGRSPGIDRGIVRAHERGIVTSTTLMANAPGAERAAALARECPSLDVGVHLVLTYARPLTDPRRIPSLVEPDGSFPRSPSAIIGEGRVDGEEAL